MYDSKSLTTKLFFPIVFSQANLCSLSVTLNHIGHTIPSSFPPLRVLTCEERKQVSFWGELFTLSVRGGTGGSILLVNTSILPKWLLQIDGTVWVIGASYLIKIGVI